MTAIFKKSYKYLDKQKNQKFWVFNLKFFAVLSVFCNIGITLFGVELLLSFWFLLNLCIFINSVFHFLKDGRKKKKIYYLSVIIFTIMITVLIYNTHYDFFSEIIEFRKSISFFLLPVPLYCWALIFFNVKKTFWCKLTLIIFMAFSLTTPATILEGLNTFQNWSILVKNPPLAQPINNEVPPSANFVACSVYERTFVIPDNTDGFVLQIKYVRQVVGVNFTLKDYSIQVNDPVNNLPKTVQVKGLCFELGRFVPVLTYSLIRDSIATTQDLHELASTHSGNPSAFYIALEKHIMTLYNKLAMQEAQERGFFNIIGKFVKGVKICNPAVNIADNVILEVRVRNEALTPALASPDKIIIFNIREHKLVVVEFPPWVSENTALTDDLSEDFLSSIEDTLSPDGDLKEIFEIETEGHSSAKEFVMENSENILKECIDTLQDRLLDENCDIIPQIVVEKQSISMTTQNGYFSLGR